MNKRHHSNSNLILHYGGDWNGLPVQCEYGPLVVNYLQRIHETLGYSLNEYPRTCAMRFELRFPWYWPESDTAVISRFFDSLNSQIEADENRRIRAGKRVHKTRLRYAWVKERDGSWHWHYHVVIFVNRDAYCTFGNYRKDQVESWLDMPRDHYADKPVSMAEKIVNAWASALRCTPEQLAGVLNFSNNGVYAVNVNASNYVEQFVELFHRLSYLAKVDTKHYGDAGKSFGSSRG